MSLKRPFDEIAKFDINSFERSLQHNFELLQCGMDFPCPGCKAVINVTNDFYEKLGRSFKALAILNHIVSGACSYTCGWVYVIRCGQDGRNLYVGYTNSPLQRFREHHKGSGASVVQHWGGLYNTPNGGDLTVENLQESLLGLSPGSTMDEMQQFEKVWMMYLPDRHDRVRGAQYTRINLSPRERYILDQMEEHALNRCFLCGKDGHFKRDCPEAAKIKKARLASTGSVKFRTATQDAELSGSSKVSRVVAHSNDSPSSSSNSLPAISREIIVSDTTQRSEIEHDIIYPGFTFSAYSINYFTDNMELNAYLQNALTGSAAAIAKFLLKWKPRFASNRKYWYYFDGMKWIKDLEGDYFREICLGKEFQEILNGIIKCFETDKSKLKALHAVKQKVMTTNFIDDVIKEASSCLNVEKSFEKLLPNLDMVPNIVGFTDGVFDLNTMRFRPANYDDYITLTTGCTFADVQAVTNETIMDVNAFLSKVLPDREARDYVMETVALSLKGDVGDTRKLNICKGNGANGKSTLMKLIGLALGEYCVPIRSTGMTETSGRSNKFNNDIDRTKSRRVVIMNEIDVGRPKVNTHTLKTLLGSDPIVNRAIYKGDVTFYSQYQMFWLLNFLPKIKDVDEGTWRRIALVPFNSMFVDSNVAIDPTEQYVYHIDPTLNERMGKWGPAFMKIILENYFPNVQKNGLIIPPNLQLILEEFRTDCDTDAKLFIGKYLEPGDSHLHICTIKHVYRSWYYLRKGNISSLNQKTFPRMLITAGVMVNKNVREQRRGDNKQLGVKYTQFNLVELRRLLADLFSRAQNRNEHAHKLWEEFSRHRGVLQEEMKKIADLISKD